MATLKKKIRNGLIYLFWLTGLPALRCWWLRRQGPLVRVLVYHDVPTEEVDAFAEQVRFLKETCNLLTPQDFKEKNFDPDKINILLTFDDGYRSWAEVVLPVLKKYGVDGIFFVISGFVDTAGEVNREEAFCRNNLGVSHRRPLTWSQVQEIDKEQNCAVGGHTRNHKRLTDLSAEESFREVQVDKNKLENQLARSLDFFAFPYGKHGDIAGREAVGTKAGYGHSFSTEIDFANRGVKDPVPRTMISPTMNHFLLTCLIGGVYDVK